MRRGDFGASELHGLKTRKPIFRDKIEILRTGNAGTRPFLEVFELVDLVHRLFVGMDSAIFESIIVMRMMRQRQGRFLTSSAPRPHAL